MIYIGFLLFILSGMFEAVMDKLQFHYDLSIFKNFKNQDALKAKCKKMISMLGNYVPHELLDNLKSGFS
jgi:hypothetical protein